MPLSITEAVERLKSNEERFDGFINGEGYTTIGGGVVEGVPGFLGRVEEGIKEATGTVASNLAASQAARAGAEAARDAAQVSGHIYASIAAGLAATAVGGYFMVPVANSNDALILYRVDTGPNATELCRFASSLSYLPDAPFGYKWAVVDALNRAAIGIKDDGTFAAAKADLLEAVVGLLTAGSGQLLEALYMNLKWAVVDANGRAAIGVADDGTFLAKEMQADRLTVQQINGLPFNAASLGNSRFGGVYSHSINFVNNSGQSLGEGSTPAQDLTTVQEYDNVGFPARSSAPTSFVPLTTSATKVAGRGESPMYGTLGHIKELIAEENGVPYASNDYQLVGCNNAYSGYSILALNKGSTPYANALAQVQAAYTLAQSSSKTMSFQAVTWTQGESDASMAKDTYKGHLKQLINDYNIDGKAITGQFNPVFLISYQNATVNRNIALAQLEASNEHPLIKVACPMYQFDYGDAQHITAESSKWLGGYYGLVYKRVIVDRQDWKPLQPIAHSVIGNSIDVVFNKSGLVLDTVGVPTQADYGFSVVNGSGVAQAISSVTIIQPNRVRLTFSSAPTTGWAVRYGYGSATGKGSFTGGCGNLRDSQGDTLVYSAINKPMHNWCVIFNYPI